MAALPWFRMYHETATDPKVQMMGEANQRRYIMLLCLRCCNGDVTLQDEEVAFQLRISEGDYADTKALLIERGLIDDNNKPVAWDKHDGRAGRMQSNHWSDLRSYVFLRDDYTCQYCSERGGKLECDHVEPLSLGGSDHPDNLVTACFACNRSKHAKTPEQWPGRTH